MELRERAGFKTQGALATEAEIDPSKLSKIENDKPVNLTLTTLERLAAALKVGVADLFGKPRPESDAGHGSISVGDVGSGAGLADSLRRTLAQYEETGQFPKDFRGDIMLAIFTLTRALQRAADPGESAAENRKAQ